MAHYTRAFVDRYGYRMRYAVNNFVARYSDIPDQAVFPQEDFDWTGPSAAEWRAVRDEFLERSPGDASFRAISDLSADHDGLDPDKKWHSAVLYGYGIRIDENCARYPVTAALVERIPGLVSAMFSVLQPGAYLPSHVGVTKGVLTCHLGLSVPASDERVAIDVEGCSYHWQEGRWFLFDDTRRHEAWNRTGEPRAVLLCHVKRPMHGLGRLVQELFFKGVVRSAFVQDFYAGIRSYTEASTEVKRGTADGAGVPAPAE